MPDARSDGAPDNRKTQQRQVVRQVVRLAVTAAAGIFGLGYWAAHINGGELVAMARVLISVTAVILAGSIFADRMAHRLARIEKQLELKPLTRTEYWGVYSDVLTDLGGIDGEGSTDSGRLPPRP